MVREELLVTSVGVQCESRENGYYNILDSLHNYIVKLHLDIIRPT